MVDDSRSPVPSPGLTIVGLVSQASRDNPAAINSAGADSGPGNDDRRYRFWVAVMSVNR